MSRRCRFGKARLSYRLAGLWAVAVAATILTSTPVVPTAPVQAAETVLRPCPHDAVDAAAAEAAAVACAGRVEILAERTEWSQTFANPDRSRTVEETIEPVRVRKGAAWVPVDTSLKASANVVAPRASVLPMSFSPGGNGPLARISDGGRQLAMSWPGRLPKPILYGDTAVYRDVLPGADLRLTAQALGFSEVLVVRTREAAANPKLVSLRFGLSTRGVTVSKDTGGGLVARDGKGKVIFTAPAPLMWDSSGQDPAAGEAGPPAAEPRGERRAVMPVRVDKASLTLVPDKRMLADPNAKLPIYIDPAWTGSVSGGAWTSVWSKHKSSSFWKNSSALQRGSTYGSAGAGRTEDCSGCSDHIIRSLFQMDTSRVRNKQILGATFRIEQRWSWTCSPKSNAKLWMTGAISSSTTWNRQPTWYSSYTAQSLGNRKLGSAHGCKGSGTIEFNVKSMVAKAAAGNWSTLTLGLRAVDERTKNQWKRFNHSSPKLAITYNTKPYAPSSRYSDGKACATGSSRPYVRTLTPTLAAIQSDPDADQGLTTSFYWWVSGGSRSEANKVSQSAGNKTSVSRPIPSGRLSDGRTYGWQALTSDAHTSGDWSATCEFTVDVTAPPTPATVTSSEYPADSTTSPGHGGVGLPGQFSIAAQASGVGDVVGYAWTLNPGVQASAATQVTASSSHTATITYKPVRDGVHALRVWTKDRAGWYSAQPYTYTFKVRAGGGPAAHWTYDEGAGAAVDVTEHGNALTLSGGAARVAGRSGVGQALSLDGTDDHAATSGPVLTAHPDTGDPVQVGTESSFTVAAWVRLSATGGTVVRSAVAIDGGTSSAFSLGYSGSANRWRFAVAGSDVASPTWYEARSNAAPTAGKWTHLTGVYDVSTRAVRLYVNGVAQTTTATVTGGFRANGGLAVGRHKAGGAAAGFFAGAVDEVRLYSFPVAAAEVAALAVPLSPSVSFPDGDSVVVGATATAVISAGGDANVVSYSYSIGSDALNQTKTPSTAGGPVTVNLPTSTAGVVKVYAVAVDANGRRSATYQLAELTVFEAATLSGFVLDAQFSPLAGAVVTVGSTGRSATSAPDGSYTVTGFPAGTYQVTASYGGPCGVSTTMSNVEIGRQSNLDLVLTPVADDLGYTCATRTAVFGAAGTALPLSGDDAVTVVDLPFAFPFYESSYRSAWVDTNGVISFTDPGGSRPYDGSSLPSQAAPNAVVAPFWDDLVVDSSASVRTVSSGTEAAATFTVEWRNVRRKADAGQRLSFEVTLAADGTVITNYDGLDGDAERGANAIVGIEAASGEDGFTYSARQPVLASGQAVVFDYPGNDSPLELFDLSGTLTDVAGAPVVGGVVTLDPSGLTTTTGADGAWRFDDLVADSYTVAASTGGRCPTMARAQVELAADTVQNLRYGPDYGGLGYACTVADNDYVYASTVLSPTSSSGGRSLYNVDPPFPVVFHGKSYDKLKITDDGFVTFTAAEAWLSQGLANPPLPTPSLWRSGLYAVVAPFWDELTVDEQASVRVDTKGTAPDRAYVVEWRNVLITGTDSRIRFEVKFHENGQLAFHYGPLVTDGERGAGATIGLQSRLGTVAAPFSFNEAALTTKSSITFTPGPAGTIGGTVTAAVTGNPVAGATVSLAPTGLTTTSAADGSYQFTDVPVGEYKVSVASGDQRCTGRYSVEKINLAGGVSDVDLSLMVEGDEFGYACTSGTHSYVAGDAVEAWTGDDTVWQKNPPFPLKLYGSSYTSAWISANGVVSLMNPAAVGGIGAEPADTPSAAEIGQPNAAVYVAWDDWVVDSSAHIATKTSGTAPNRQWVVEWHNVAHHDNPSARASFEVIFSEGGGITLAYADIDATNDLEQGSGALIGIENASGTIAFQYAFEETWLASGQGITFTPSQPGPGTVSGAVTCAGSVVSEATVTVAGKSATTAADGTYTVGGVPAGTYAVIATMNGGACAGSRVTEATVGTNTTTVASFAAAATPAGAGYRLSEQVVPYTPANGGVLALTGDDAYARVSLPFPITLYGQSFSSGWVDTNGLVSFTDPGEPSSDSWPIPSTAGPGEPNAAVYPFWHDWVVDAEASVRTATVGSAPNRQFIVEWRNVFSYEDPNTRVSFEVVFDEAGGFGFAYTDLDGTFLELGGGATIGIENADGTVALQYTYRQPVMRAGMGLRFTAPAS